MDWNLVGNIGLTLVLVSIFVSAFISGRNEVVLIFSIISLGVGFLLLGLESAVDHLYVFAMLMLVGALWAFSKAWIVYQTRRRRAAEEISLMQSFSKAAERVRFENAKRVNQYGER